MTNTVLLMSVAAAEGFFVFWLMIYKDELLMRIPSLKCLSCHFYQRILVRSDVGNGKQLKQ